MGGIFISKAYIKLDKFKKGQTYLHYFNNVNLPHNVNDIDNRFWIIFKVLDSSPCIDLDIIDLKIIDTSAPAYQKYINGYLKRYNTIPVWLYDTEEISESEIIAKIL